LKMAFMFGPYDDTPTLELQAESRKIR
jgi:hypothetical protein